MTDNDRAGGAGQLRGGLPEPEREQAVLLQQLRHCRAAQLERGATQPVNYPSHCSLRVATVGVCLQLSAAYAVKTAWPLLNCMRRCLIVACLFSALSSSFREWCHCALFLVYLEHCTNFQVVFEVLASALAEVRVLPWAC